MTHGDSLARTVEATQRSLDERLGEVLAPHRDPHRPRDTFAATDAFLAATSRHLSAVEAVLVDQVRHTVPDADSLVHDYLLAARDLEHTMFLVKGRPRRGARDPPRLGAAVGPGAGPARGPQPAGDPAGRRAGHGDPDLVDGLARRVFDAETHAPTRPHPMLPHVGLLGRLSRWIWAVADRFWDAAEGASSRPRCARVRTGTTAWWPSTWSGTRGSTTTPTCWTITHRRRQDRARWAARSRTASPASTCLQGLRHRRTSSTTGRCTPAARASRSGGGRRPDGPALGRRGERTGGDQPRAAFRRGLSRSTHRPRAARGGTRSAR